MLLARKIAEGTFLLSSSNLITVFINFLTTIILIRVLDVYGFGLLMLTLAGFLIASIFLDLGIASVIITDVSREIEAKRVDRAKSLLVRYAQAEVIMGFGLFTIAFLSSFFIVNIYNEVIANLVRVGSFFLIFTGAKNVFIVVFNSHLKFKYFSFMQIVESISKLLFVIVLIVIMSGGVLEAMAIYPLSIFTCIVFSLPLFLKTTKYLKRVKRARESLFFKTVKGHGKWVVGSVSLKNLTGNITPWIVEYFLGVNSVAIFSVATKLSNFFDSLIKSLEVTLMPITSKEIFKWERTKFMLNRSIKYALWISVPSFIFLWIAAPVLIEILFTKSYLASVGIFRILLLILIVYSFGLIFRPLFYALKAQKYLLYAYVSGLISLIILEILLIQFIGLVGVAIALVFNALIITILRYYFAKKLKPDFRIEIKGFFKMDEFDKKMFRKIKNRF